MHVLALAISSTAVYKNLNIVLDYVSVKSTSFSTLI
jgi:hypothetical protein